MRKKTDSCPYSDKDQSCQCKIVKGGLYIPILQHVEVYCSTFKYTQCPQYVRGHDHLYETAGKYGLLTSNGRRRYRRIAENIMLSISACDETGHWLYMIDERARIIDLSLGGFGIKSSGEFQKDMMVTFKFLEGFFYPDMVGKGKIHWCKGSVESKHYQAGVAFVDERLSEAVGEHIGLPMH